MDYILSIILLYVCRIFRVRSESCRQYPFLISCFSHFGSSHIHFLPAYILPVFCFYSSVFFFLFLSFFYLFLLIFFLFLCQLPSHLLPSFNCLLFCSLRLSFKRVFFPFLLTFIQWNICHDLCFMCIEKVIVFLVFIISLRYVTPLWFMEELFKGGNICLCTYSFVFLEFSSFSSVRPSVFYSHAVFFFIFHGDACVSLYLTSSPFWLFAPTSMVHSCVFSFFFTSCISRLLTGNVISLFP